MENASRPEVKIIAHRGASGDAPENTFEAFLLAWKQDADGIEGDVRLTRDGVPVIIHDDNTLRTGGRDRLVSDQTLTELKEIRVGDPERGFTDIPTLNEALASIHPGKLFFLEIKEPTGMLPAIENALTVFPYIDSIYFISFDREILKNLKQAHPDWKTLLLLEKPGSDPHRQIQSALTFIKEHDLEGLGLANQWRKHPALVAEVCKAGKILSVWTVNEIADALLWIRLGAGFITTDYPGKLSTAIRNSRF